MKVRSLLVATVLAASVAGNSWAAYGVRISDLGNVPVPPNPVRVWGQVTGDFPLIISDGRAEITVTGRTAALGEFLVLDGWWNGRFLSTASLEMLHIPAGSFLMGNNGSEPYSYSNELPQHSADLPSYWIGRYEVTRGEYAQFIAAGGYSTPAYWSTDGWSWKMNTGRTQPSYWEAVQNWGSPPGAFTQTASYPVVGATYYEAEAFCNWAGGRLPTEAQWEKAARWTGSYPNVYPWGNVWDWQKCNNWEDTLYPGYQTAPVGSYPAGASPYGAQDMAGNAIEWVQDWYKSYPGSSAPFDYTGIYRVLRGASWVYSGLYCRCAARLGNYPDVYECGFRLAR